MKVRHFSEYVNKVRWIIVVVCRRWRQGGRQKWIRIQQISTATAISDWVLHDWLLVASRREIACCAVQVRATDATIGRANRIICVMMRRVDKFYFNISSSSSDRTGGAGLATGGNEGSIGHHKEADSTGQCARDKQEQTAIRDGSLNMTFIWTLWYLSLQSAVWRIMYLIYSN